MKNRVVILVRQDDGSWTTDGRMFTPSTGRRVVAMNRIIGGIQSRTYSAKEYAALHPEVELEDAL